MTGSTVDSTHDGPTPCGCTSGGNVWYRFTTPRRGVVYLDTAGSSYDTSIFLTDSSGTTVAGSCNDDARCTTGGFTSGLQSRMALVLPRGTYYVAVGGCGTGSFSLDLQFIPDNAGTRFFETAISGTSNTGLIPFGTGSSVTTSSCGGSGIEDVRWFMTCGGLAQSASMCRSDGGYWTRSLGGTYYDPTAYFFSAQTGSQVVCNDDGRSMGATDCRGALGLFGPLDSAHYGSRLNAVVVPRGIATLVIDNRNTNTGMWYATEYELR